MLYLIKPRYDEPVHHTQSGMGYLPRWVYWPYDFVKFLVNVIKEMVHADSPGIFKLLLIPFGIAFAWEKFVNSWQDAASMIFLLIIGVLSVMAKDRGQVSPTQWYTRYWNDDLHYYGDWR